MVNSIICYGEVIFIIMVSYQSIIKIGVVIVIKWQANSESLCAFKLFDPQHTLIMVGY